MTHTLELIEIGDVTHDTRRLVFTRPDGFDFEPGQATHFALDKDGWRDEDRPFTMTSQPGDDRLEFVIKIYPDHDGVTEQIDRMRPGDRVLAEDPAGAITDHGAGTFIAGGAGITPYIPLMRRRARDGNAEGCHLVYSNKTEADIILREEWEAMDGLRTSFVVTDSPGSDLPRGPIDAAYLKTHLGADDGPFYICGPKPMVNDIREALQGIGIDEIEIVTEAGW
jgi:ferredoxin-NADP reductase